MGQYDILLTDRHQRTNKRTNENDLLDGPVLKPEGRRGDELAKSAAVASTVVFVVYTVFIVLTSNPFSLSWFAFHPPLQAIALALFTYGILTLQPTSQPRTKAAGLIRHQIYIGFIGVPIIFAGTWAVYHNKNINGRSHFVTWHGVCIVFLFCFSFILMIVVHFMYIVHFHRKTEQTIGILSIVWLVIQCLFGGATVWFDGALLGGGMKAKRFWKFHRMSGYVLFGVFMYTLWLGGQSSFVKNNSSFIMRILAYTMAPLTCTLAVYSRARLSKMGFF